MLCSVLPWNLNLNLYDHLLQQDHVLSSVDDVRQDLVERIETRILVSILPFPPSFMLHGTTSIKAALNSFIGYAIIDKMDILLVQAFLPAGMQADLKMVKFLVTRNDPHKGEAEREREEWEAREEREAREREAGGEGAYGTLEGGAGGAAALEDGNDEHGDEHQEGRPWRTVRDGEGGAPQHEQKKKGGKKGDKDGGKKDKKTEKKVAFDKMEKTTTGSALSGVLSSPHSMGELFIFIGFSIAVFLTSWLLVHVGVC